LKTDELAAALQACASGLYPLEAGVALLASSGAFLHRSDFTTRFIEHGASSGIAMAAINWGAAVTALDGGGLPCSGGERRLLMLSASLADGIPVDLRDAATGLDDRNIQRLLAAIIHASGKRPENGSGSSTRCAGAARDGGQVAWRPGGRPQRL
jgi:hypothetical protein